MMKKIIAIISVLLIICAISMYFTDDQTQEPSQNDLRIWFPSGYEIMKKVDMNDIEIISELEKRLDIPLYYKSVSGDIASLFQTQMSDLSDVDLLYYTFDQAQITSALHNDLFMDYTAYLDKLPHLVEQFEKHPELYQKACPNNQCVVFPATKEHAFSNLVIAYRSDWAKQAGYEQITNLTELQDMLNKERSLFEKKELKQQGTYFLGLSSYRSYINSFMRLFETSDETYKEKDELVYGPITEEYREYLSYLKGLYQQELLDPRLYETSETDMEKFFLNSQCSAILTTYDHAKQLQAFSVVNGDDIPLSYVSMEQLYQQKDSYRKEDRRYQVLDFGYVIKAGLSEEKRNQALAYIDYLYSEEGMELTNFGIKDVHYEDTAYGKRYLSKITEGNTYYPIAISSYVKQDLLRIDASSDFTMLDEEIQQQIDMDHAFIDHSVENPDGYISEDKQELMSNIQVSLETFVQETSMKFIFRDVDPNDDEDWKDYVNGLYHMGLKEYMEIQESAMQKRNGAK